MSPPNGSDKKPIKVAELCFAHHLAVEREDALFHHGLMSGRVPFPHRNEAWAEEARRSSKWISAHLSGAAKLKPKQETTCINTQDHGRRRLWGGLIHPLFKQLSSEMHNWLTGKHSGVPLVRKTFASRQCQEDRCSKRGIVQQEQVDETSQLNNELLTHKWNPCACKLKYPGRIPL